MHTPAPWTIGGPRLTALTAQPVYDVFMGAGDDGAIVEGANAAANARLIAACPDLVAALQQIADGCERRLRKGHDEGDAASLDIARAAIAKALGE